jgi:hypothetical protein
MCVATLLLLSQAGCGKADDVAVRVGSHKLTTATVHHWMSALRGKGSNLHEPGPPVPVPPQFKACVASERAHPSPELLARPHTTTAQLKAFCDFEYRRFRLKALYLLISYQWVTGEAAELGVKLDRAEVRRQLSAFEHAVAPSHAAFKQDLRYWRARPSDILLSLELAQLTSKIESKVEAKGGGSPQGAQRALLAFGRQFKRKWRARTRCTPPYVVPICREYKTPKTPPDLVPPSVPLTGLPAGS